MGFSMGLVERAKAIIIRPKETWEIIRSEEMTVKDLFASYACILAMIPAVASFIGLSLIGVAMPFMGTLRQPVIACMGHAVLYYILLLAGVFVTACIADLLAPNFDSKRDFTKAVKTVVFSSTPTWVSGVLHIIPALGTITWILGLYSLYLLFLGLPLMMETPPEKKAGYVAVVMIVTVLVMATVSVITGLFLTGAGITGMAPGL